MSRRTFAAVTLVLCLLPLVARAPLLGPDEGLHAAIAQEIARGGDDVTPTFLGEPFLDKPSPRCEKCDRASVLDEEGQAFPSRRLAACARKVSK